ncbi:MAG TPA: DUF2796 domain-containing protein [Ramlibacter sp.]|uniref:DUF2796 domain-containing protein n=1 Tax=Ramlibacter sp. TaxID=1917967 RepID=UPI002BD426CB|nr:DUF2796 domain-containing protein [Ramlibacter sp.]HVZ44502.1 DUF2796 domain-containing protein [Ramlibacter sp.]
MKHRTTAAAVLLVACATAMAAGKHEHGVARLDVAVEANTISFQLESPLDNLLGFEHPPRTAGERERADALVAKLRSADGVFRLDPAARCKLQSVELVSSALKLGNPGPSEEGHADIDGSFTFTCARAADAAYVDTGLFTFARMQRVDVQVARPGAQFGLQLVRPSGRLDLVR